jgi:hypothetical protein
MKNSLVEDSGTSIIGKLLDALKDATIGGFDGVPYIPSTTIKDILSFDSVSNALNEISPDLAPQETQKHTSAICESNSENGAANLFAILILCDAAAEIFPLLLQGITDANLPFRLYDNRDIQ